jgi:hypothetical protein
LGDRPAESEAGLRQVTEAFGGALAAVGLDERHHHVAAARQAPGALAWIRGRVGDRGVVIT